MSSTPDDEPSLLSKLDSVIPAPLAQFDAFPKLPSTYKARSESRGLLTIFISLLAFLLMLNDIGEYIWGWPDHEFTVDFDTTSYMGINVDLVVNMPCRFLSVDVRDALGDRLLLSRQLRRDGTLFDVDQATALKAHSTAISARQAIAESRTSRGLFSFFRRSTPEFRPTFNFQADGSACRVWGSLEVRKVTANLHITTLGHGYASYEHVDHNLMNLSHIINEFSFGPFFPDITQPLDYSFEATDEPFISYQYFLHVVPTTYIAPRNSPLETNQYSVTHYTRVLSHNVGTPGIFFRFDLDPLSLTIHQRTTTFTQLVIRCVGVIGGVFVCMGYAIRITTRAVEVVSGADQTPGIVAAEASGAKVGLRQKWGGGQLRARTDAATAARHGQGQGNGWGAEGGSTSPYAYGGSPMSGGFLTPGVQSPYSPYLASPVMGGTMPQPSIPPTPNPGSGVGLGFSGPYGPQPLRTPGFGPPPGPPRSPSAGSAPRSPVMGAGSAIPTVDMQGSHGGPAAPGVPLYGPKKDD